MLGAAQWAWLRAQLLQPAELRLIVSSVQVLAEGHGWEGWDNLPLERTRLLDLIDQTAAGGVIFVSGDRHVGALYQRPTGAAYALYEITASGINMTFAGNRDPGRAAPGRSVRRGELRHGRHRLVGQGRASVGALDERRAGAAGDDPAGRPRAEKGSRKLLRLPATRRPLPRAHSSALRARDRQPPDERRDPASGLSRGPYFRRARAAPAWRAGRPRRAAPSRCRRAQAAARRCGSPHPA